MDSRGEAVALVAVMLLSLLPILIIASFNHPSADDFGYAIDTHAAVQAGESLPRVVAAAAVTSAKLMRTWQGLYSSGFVLALQPAIFGEQYYALGVYVLLGFLALGIASFYRVIYKYILRDPSRDWVLLAVSTLFFIVQTMVSPVQGLFWFNGAANYMLFWSLLLCCLSATIVYLQSSGRRAAAAIALATALAFVVAGGNHVTAFACILISAAIVVFVLYKKEKKVAVVGPLVASSVGFYIVMSAPGTRIRAAALGHSGSVRQTIAGAVESLARYANGWVSISLLCLLVIVTPAILRALGKLAPGSVRVKPGLLVLSALSSAILLVGMESVPWQAMGNPGTGRLQNVIYATFVILVVLNFGLLLAYLSVRYRGAEGMGSAVAGRSILSFLLLVGCVLFVLAFGNQHAYTTSTSGLAAFALVDGSAQTYHKELNKRIAAYDDSTIRNVVVRPLSVKPHVLYFDDITKDVDNSKNRSLAQYYGKDSVVVRAGSGGR